MRGARVAAGLVLAVTGVLGLTGCGPPKPIVSMADGSGREGALVPFPTRLESNGSGNPDTASADVDLYCTTENGSAVAGADYVGMTDQYCGTIPAGARSTTINVQALADGEWESHEDFVLRYRVVGPATAGRGYATGQVL